jgi:GR25 family glycosyltransferase involved in LPS biosynthesis
MPAGHVGNTLSHWMVWQYILLAGHQEALITEDDVYFMDDFHKSFQQAYQSLPADWQVVYVGSVGTEKKQRREVKPGICIVDVPFGMHCYLVKRNALPVLLETGQQARTHIDIQVAENSLPRLKYYVLWPRLAGQHTVDHQWLSSVGAGGETAFTCPLPEPPR